MKKINNRGFVLAETLIVSVFLLVIFGMLYSNFYPLIGEYEKRESYDDVDSKYAVYWIKKIIEDGSYNPPNTEKGYYNNNRYFFRFKCSDIGDEAKRDVCINLVSEFEVDGCDNSGKKCEIFITPYTIDKFKETVNNGSVKRFKESCTSSDSVCKQEYIDDCVINYPTKASDEIKTQRCTKKATKSVFDTGLEEYITLLPDYRAQSLNSATSRVIVRFHHRKDSNSYYSYATIEVNR